MEWAKDPYKSLSRESRNKTTELSPVWSSRRIQPNYGHSSFTTDPKIKPWQPLHGTQSCGEEACITQ